MRVIYFVLSIMCLLLSVVFKSLGCYLVFGVLLVLFFVFLGVSDYCFYKNKKKKS